MIYEVRIALVHRTDDGLREQSLRQWFSEYLSPASAVTVAFRWALNREEAMNHLDADGRYKLAAVHLREWRPLSPDASGYIQGPGGATVMEWKDGVVRYARGDVEAAAMVYDGGGPGRFA